MVERLHDAVTGDLVALFALLLAVPLAWLLARRHQRVRRILRGTALGVALTLASLAVTSTAASGDLLRTRAGLPHFAVTSNLDASSGVRRTVVHPLYLAGDILFWWLVGVVGASLARNSP